MIRLFILLPIVMCLIWWLYITIKGYHLKDCKQGFKYILAFNVIIISFFLLMIWLIDYP